MQLPPWLMIEFLKCVAAAGMLASLAFACWPLWFLDRTGRNHPRWRIAFKLLAMAGVAGWIFFFRHAIQSATTWDGSILSLAMTGGLCWIIYLAAIRAESLAYQEKLRVQTQRNAAKRG